VETGTLKILDSSDLFGIGKTKQMASLEMKQKLPHHKYEEISFLEKSFRHSKV
jgi:hypothetical protein